MSESSKAVFLSYASQDAEAARRICEALRAAGVEVWFDQSELRGGDAWDAKIRKQIKECTLFVPVISANTQARAEGYFRREWRLAVDRMHDLADDHPFLLPVVIDDTPDAAARVPERFRERQWTRLPVGETSPAFAARVKKLLSGSEAVGGALRPDSFEPSRHKAAPTKKPKRWLAPVIGGAVVALVAVVISRPWQKAARMPEGTKPAEPVKAVAPLSEARKLELQARALMDDDSLAVRENYKTAYELCERAAALSPDDGEVWATMARANLRLIFEYREDSEKRRAALRSQVERAGHLAPLSIEAGLATAGYELFFENNVPAARARLVDLHQRAPADRRVLRMLVSLEEDRGQDVAEARRWTDVANALPGGDAGTLLSLAWVHWGRNEFPQVRAAVEKSLSIKVMTEACQLKLLLLEQSNGLEEALRYLQEVPAAVLREDRVALVAYEVRLYTGDYEGALRTMTAVPREILEEGLFFYARGYLAGNALLLLGRTNAAKVEFGAALRALDERLVETPRDSRFIYQRAMVLARLGETAQAEQQLATARELGRDEWYDADTSVLLGHYDEALASFTRTIDRTKSRWPGRLRYLKYDPLHEPLRRLPQGRALVAQADGWLREMLAGPTENPVAVAPAAKTDDKSVAVLPFENRSAGGEDSVFLADGIHEDLINTLSRVPGLKVMSRTAVQRFKVADAAMPDIAAALKVSHVVEAGVQREGNQVRINVQLVRAADGQTVWSERYDRVLSAGGIFALQEEITAAVAKALQLQLEPGPDGKLIPGTTKNLAAYEAFLKGRLTWKNTGSNDQEAIALFKRAVELDPGFALAYGAMAEAYVTLGNSGAEAPARVFPLAKETADRALAIDPRCIQALTALGEYAFHYEWDWDKADRLLRQALVVDPNYANAYGWLAGHLRMMNRAAEANVMLQRKLELEPERPIARLNYERESKLAAKQYDAAVALARQIVDQARGQFFGSLLLGGTLREAGRPQEARPILEQAVAQFPDQLKLSEELGLTYAALGQTAQARGLLTRLAAIRETRFVSPLLFASIAASLNDRDLAFAEITRAFEVHDPFLPSLGVDENLASLKDDPRFREVLKRLKLDTVFPEAVKK